MGSKMLTYGLIGGGIAGWIVGINFFPMVWGDFNTHLVVTGVSAVVIGLGLARTSLGRERSD